eukprot:2076412-Rhodomonas_salina.1
MIIALYVDDGLVAHNSDAAYSTFIKALATRFELSADSTEVSWYLVSQSRGIGKRERSSFHRS